MVEVRAVPRGLLVDWGGVLTSGLEPALRRWAELDDFDFDSYLEAVLKWLPSDTATAAELNPVHALERGQIAVPDFERKLASLLVRRANERGIRTALLSNSWGNTYPRDTWDGMFDDIVISGEVGLRKPEPEIFRLAADRIGLEPAECVFVDDLQLNVDGARSVGMTALLHTEYDETRRALEDLFGADLT